MDLGAIRVCAVRAFVYVEIPLSVCFGSKRIDKVGFTTSVLTLIINRSYKPPRYLREKMYDSFFWLTDRTVVFTKIWRSF